MGSYDTTATASGWANMDESQPNTSNYPKVGNESRLQTGGAPASFSRERQVLGFLLPAQPLGADSIQSLFVTVTTSQFQGVSPPGPRTWQIYSTRKLAKGVGSTGTATWYTFDTASSWTNKGGDLDTLVGSASVNGGYGSSYAIDVTAINTTWGNRMRIILKDAAETSSGFWDSFSTYLTNSTVAWMPHLTIRYLNNPPAAITDLSISPDLSLTEASYTYKQHAQLKWSSAKESDFYRYRLRYGINRSQPSDHSHRAFIYSRGSTAFSDGNYYGQGSTVYYSIYAEDNKNQSASTNANVSNVASWTTPNIYVGAYTGATASVLGLCEIDAGTWIGTLAANQIRKLIVTWGDGGKSYSVAQSAGGGYFYARHRYSKATTFTARAQLEDVYGFRSPFASTGTFFVIGNLAPIAKIVASPSRQRTASTFSFGSIPEYTTQFVNGRLFLNTKNPAPADGVVTRFSTRATVLGTGVVFAQLWRLEGGYYRCIYSDQLTLATVSANIARSVNWAAKAGDYVGIHVTSTGPNLSGGSEISAPYETRFIASLSTVSTPGTRIPAYRFSIDTTTQAPSAAKVAYTNPIAFSSKDSYARGSNRTLNRFRWAPDYSGDFSAAYGTAGSYTTGATTSFYWAWTSSGNKFLATRSVDDTNASSIDVAGVVIETEATFRIPDDLRDVETFISEKEQRAFTVSPVISRDYGVFDFGAIEPRQFTVKGHAVTPYTAASGFGDAPIDAQRVRAIFSQRKRVIFRPATSATYIQGYVMEKPVTRTAEDPLAVDWTATIIEAR